MTPYTASQIGGKPHGLKTIENEDNIPNGLGSGPADALRYLRQPDTLPNTNKEGQPRQKNRFILISAGPDRVYGTADDITSFGNP